MILIKNADELRSYLDQLSGNGTSIGFIPTMGALHEGHTRLIRQSLDRGNFTVCSIFVNPTQFNNPTDFAKYPKTLDADITTLEAAGADLLFVPGVEEIYPGGTTSLETFDLGYLETILEGSSRPGHFQGVCLVMKRLLTIVHPQQLFMGQKDYQQCMVVSWLLSEMKSDTELVTVPTVREKSGLAMSSRNMRLSEAGKLKATGIYKTLQFVNAFLKPGDLAELLSTAVQQLREKGFKVDYVKLAGAADLKITTSWDGHTPLVCLVAAFIEEVRLIDNMMMTTSLTGGDKDKNK